MAAFAVELGRREATSRTADRLTMLQRAFENDWRENGRIRTPIAIPLPPPRNKALYPVGCELIESEILFDFKIGDSFEVDGLPACAEFQVRVTGHVQYDTCIVNLEDHWRVDTHTFDGVTNEPHPFIHFQRGGRAQDTWASSRNFVPGPDLPHRQDEYWLSLLQSPGPRIPFPPVCPILAIDFVIGQHDGPEWAKLRLVPEYRALVTHAQARIWEPFFGGLGKPERRRKWLGDMVT